MVRMCVSLVELPSWTMMGCVPVLEYMLLVAHGLLQQCLIITG
jgi:hypothetical protein